MAKREYTYATRMAKAAAWFDLVFTIGNIFWLVLYAKIAIIQLQLGNGEDKDGCEMKDPVLVLDHLHDYQNQVIANISEKHCRNLSPRITYFGITTAMILITFKAFAVIGLIFATDEGQDLEKAKLLTKFWLIVTWATTTVNFFGALMITDMEMMLGPLIFSLTSMYFLLTVQDLWLEMRRETFANILLNFLPNANEIIFTI